MLRIATPRSALSLWQAEHSLSAFAAAWSYATGLSAPYQG